MELASIAFRQVLTMVILIAIGVMCAKTKLIDENTNKKLASFILLLVNPLIIFLSYQRSLEVDLLQGLLISLLLAVASFGVSIFITHAIYRDRNGKNYGVDKFACVYSNCGFIGIPLVQGVFGSEGVFYLTAYLTVFNLLVWTHGVIVMSGKRDFTSVRKALMSPALIATIVGFLSFILQIRTPEFIEQPLSLIGNTNTPLAMVVAGVSISQANVGKIVKDTRVYKLCLIRLLLIPMIVVLLFSWWDVPIILTGVSSVAVSCPTAANIILFAYKYDRDYLYASELFAATTVCSMITIPLIMLLI